MEKSAIILANDSPGKLGKDKGLLNLDNKPLINHVIDAVQDIVDEIIIVANSKEQVQQYSKIASSTVQFVNDAKEPKGLIGTASIGFEKAQGKYSLLLPFNSPFVSKEIVSLLFDCCIGKSAVVPRTPDNQIESLHAVYNTTKTLEATKEALASNEVDFETMICKMRGVRYLSTLVIEQLDPDFRTFFTVDTPLDLKKALIMTKPRRSKKAI